MVDKIPRSHEIKLVHGEKAITALSLDPSGARVIRLALSSPIYLCLFLSFSLYVSFSLSLAPLSLFLSPWTVSSRYISLILRQAVILIWIFRIL